MSGSNPDTSDTSARVRALRAALGFTQEQVAARGGLTRTDVNKVETGRNKGTSDRVRYGLASAFGLSQDDIRRLFNGAISVEDALALSRATGAETAQHSTGAAA